MSDGPAQLFADMAERISKIAPDEFAGAAVIVMPGDREPIVFLTQDPAANILQFLSAVETRVEVAKNEALAAAQNQQPWAGRR